MTSHDWRLKYFHPSMLSFASGANLVSYMYNPHIFNLILGIVCLLAAIWIVGDNIEDDKNEI